MTHPAKDEEALVEMVARASCKAVGLCKCSGDKCNTSRCSVAPAMAEEIIAAVRAYDAERADPTQVEQEADRMVLSHLGMSTEEHGRVDRVAGVIRTVFDRAAAKPDGDAA